MGESLITRRAGGGEATITFDNYSGFKRTTPTTLSAARTILAGASVGNYALFGGGYLYSSSATYFSTVDAYNTSLTHTTPTVLSEARSVLAGTSVGNYAIFAGGIGQNSHSSTVDAYNASLTRTTPTVLSEARNALAGASVGDYALFAGGNGQNSYSSTVDAYSSSYLDISLFPGTKYKFNDMPSEQTSTSFQILTISTPVNGYMKIQNATLQN